MPSMSSPETMTREPRGGEAEMIAGSQAMRQIRSFVLKVAITDCTVVITGETGTGKELVAEMIHRHSQRARRSLVSINTAALPDTLLESELFGYERGAFTGAFAAQPGKLEAANGGTVFLDEIGDMSLGSQAKLLRAVEKKEIYRLGGLKRIPLDVRWVCATHRDLEKMVGEERFRSDLYYRLNVARIHLPPLRERKEDIMPLLERQLGELNRRDGRQVEGFTAEALERLLRYDWPGNVRELRNVVEAVFIHGPGRWIGADELPAPLRPRSCSAIDTPLTEREELLAALAATCWNKSQAAEKLSWSRMTLYRKLAKYGIASA